MHQMNRAFKVVNHQTSMPRRNGLLIKTQQNQFHDGMLLHTPYALSEMNEVSYCVKYKYIKEATGLPYSGILWQVMPCMRKFCETMCMTHGWTPHVAIGQQGLIRCTPVLACSPPSLVRLGWVSTHTPLAGTWVMHTRGIGLVYMILLARPPLLAQNLARICAGLLGQARCLQSPILSFPSRFPSSGD